MEYKLKNNKFYELVRSSFRSVGNRIQNFIGKNLREEIRTKSLEDIKIDICQIEDIDDILNYIVGYYNTYYSIHNLNRLMNVAILCRKQDPHSEYSFKIMIQLYLYLMIRHKEGLNKNVIISDELEIFFLFLNVIQNNISNNQVGQSVKRGRSDALQSYLNYHFDFRKEIWEYYEIARMFDGEAHEKYGFSIYQNFDKLLYIICNVKHTSDGLILDIGEFSDSELQKIFGNVNYSKLFISDPYNYDLRYITSSLQVLEGAIGIKINSTYFLPTTEHILCNIEQSLINSSKNKGDVLEKELKIILETNFGVGNVHHSLHLKTIKKEEQDFIVEVGNKILLIECKARDFKEVPFNPEVSEERRRQRFKSVILGASEQAERAKKYILNNEIAIFTDSKGVNERLKIDNKTIKEVYKVVVTLDDYYDLSEMAINYFKDETRDDLVDTWVVNYFDLQRILLHSGKDKIFDYIKYRTSGIESIKSLQVSELAQYGYYISPNYNFIPPNGLNIEINLMGRFEDWVIPFDKMKNEYVLNQIGIYKMK
ncbi:MULTISPECIES: NERD domain-containing protein [Streptococcus]|uniref:NERD domain-containing protein n=1 Tax=Streptococcus caledonicus TaxID=2614158 RepID=A0ABW0UD41_9STRE|nr:NERD domain-containing protein [Streptococcus sp. S784/96/1]